MAIAGTGAAILQLALAFATPNRLEVADIWVKSGRYAYLTVVFLLPAIALCLTLVVRSMRSRRVAAVALAVLLLGTYTVNALGLERQYYLGERVFAEYWPARMAAIVEADEEGQKILTTRPANFIDKGMDPRLVLRPEIRDTLPPVTVTPKARLDAEINYFVAVGEGDETFDLFNPGRISSVFGFPRKMKQQKGCHAEYSDFERPAVALESEDGVEIGVTSDSTEITTQIVRDGRKSEVRTWEVEPGQVHVATSAKDASLVVGFNKGGNYLICKH
jgi:hypothetical protein